MGTSRFHLALLCGLLLAGPADALPPDDPLRPRLRPSADALTNDLFAPFAAEPLKWLPDWDAAQRLAARDNRPLLAYFHSPLCGWCQRMDLEILTAPDVRRRLAAFILIRVNILEDEKTPARFRIRATPSLVFLSPEGRESFRLDGFTQKAALLEALDHVLANRLQSQDERVQSLLQQLKTQTLPEPQWAELILALGNDRQRERIQQALLALRPVPRAHLVQLLQHPLLAVRLGALEILEELTGDSFGFNPWLDLPADNTGPWQQWLAWSAATNQTATDPPALFRVLSAEETASYLQDLISDDLDRSTRARHMLLKGGASTLEGLAAFRAAHPDLPAGSAHKLRELRYTLLLPPVQGLDASSLAHRLVFGNLDVRLKALRDAAAARQRAVPVIEEFLSDSEPLVRETAIDALVAAGGRRVVTLLEKHLQAEADANVIYVVLRQLGNLRSKKGLDLLLQHLSHPNEDLVIVALESIAKLRSDLVAPQVGKCLDDPRWRVRVAALKTAAALSLQSLAPKVTAMLEDKDDFVRGAAVEALARLGAEEALPQLQALFARDDNLKGPIVQALCAADVPLPPALLQDLSNAPPSVLLSVLDHVEDADASLAPLLTTLTAHPDTDIACASLRLLARTGLEHGPYQQAVARQAQSRERRRLLAIMDSLWVEMKILARYQPAVRRPDLHAPTPAPAAASAKTLRSAVEDVFAAFETPGAAPPVRAASTATASNAVEDVFAAFESPNAATPAAGKTNGLVDEIFSAFGSAPVAAVNWVDTLLRAGRDTLHGAADAELQSAAALMLVHLGDVAGVPAVLNALSQLPEETRLRLAASASRVRSRDGLPLIQRLLADPSSEVRQTVCQAVMDDGANEACASLLLNELERKGAALRPHEVSAALRSSTYQGFGKATLLRVLQRWLKEPKEEAVQTLALVLSARVWSPEIEKLVEPFLAAPSPWQRRAAFYALGKNHRARFLKEVDRVAADPSEFVREVLPHLCLAADVGSHWTHYFDERKQESDYDYVSTGRREALPLPEEALAALRKLAQDPSERVRFSALFCLVTQEQPVDLAQVVRSLERMPKDSELLQRFSSYVFQKYARLGKEFAVVLPYLDLRQNYEEDRTRQIYEHFGLNEDEPLPRPAALAGKTAAPVIASYVPAPAAPAQPPRPENFQLVYFTKPGCKECAAVSRRLEQLQEAFPDLRVLEYDINKTASVLLHEALSKRFGVPASVRLVAPSVFSGGGYLIKDDITLDRLGQMLARAATVPLTNWLAVPTQDLAVAHERIVQRYQTTGLGLVLAAGLLDGVNPCAFATIIFLLSYLQVSRKSPRAILQIGLGYVAGVFAAYFLIGLGLAKVTATVAKLSWAGTLLTYAMAAFALVIMALNVRDGVRCQRGQMAEMTLQLPDPLKRRIHGLIRHSVRQAHFVLVAFFLGVAIAFLELACTGQVYLPTITYMIQQGESRALLNLLAYNLAFVTPLALVFALSYSGLRSETLLRLLRRRAAWVKFGTAALFLALALFLVFGQPRPLS
jgi:HEAT repeat protein/cytochrome c biogenesis protein CcdA/thioredoxin-related protein